MPKQGSIHKNYRQIKVIFTNGEEAVMRSTVTRKGDSDVIKLEIDRFTHPAWTQDVSFVNTRADSVAKFNEKFAGLSFMSKKKEEPTT